MYEKHSWKIQHEFFSEKHASFKNISAINLNYISSLFVDLEDWLLVPSSTDSVTGGKNSTFSINQNSGNISTNLLDEWEKQSKTYNWNANSTSGKISTNPLDEWEKQSMTYNWIVNDNNTSNNTSHGGLFDLNLCQKTYIEIRNLQKFTDI